MKRNSKLNIICLITSNRRWHEKLQPPALGSVVFSAWNIQSSGDVCVCVSYQICLLQEPHPPSVKRGEEKAWAVLCPCGWCRPGCLCSGLLQNELRDLAMQGRATYRQLVEFPTGLVPSVFRGFGLCAISVICLREAVLWSWSYG